METAKYKPRCFFDIAIGNDKVGRIIFELFSDINPKTCENFRNLCLGTAGIGLKTQKPLHYEGCIFHRVVKGFMIQGGDFSNGDGTGGESIFGGNFADENLTIPHDRPFLLSMANRGPDTNGSQFFITSIAAPHLNGKHVVFGHVIKGQEVVKQIEAVPVENHRPRVTVKIINCGELVIANKKKVVESSQSSSKSDSQESDSSGKAKRKKKIKKKKKKKLIQQKEDSDLEKVEYESAVKMEDIPDVPPPKFLDRFSAKQKTEKPISDRYESDSYRSKQPENYKEPYSKSGRKIKGRGALRYKTPSRSRSRSETPPHWRQAERKTQKLSREEWSSWQQKNEDYYRDKFRPSAPGKTSPRVDFEDPKQFEFKKKTEMNQQVKKKRPKHDDDASGNDEQIRHDDKARMRIPVDYSDHSDDGPDSEHLERMLREKRKELDRGFEEGNESDPYNNNRKRVSDSESDNNERRYVDARERRSPQHKRKSRQEGDDPPRHKGDAHYPPQYSRSQLEPYPERSGDIRRRFGDRSSSERVERAEYMPRSDAVRKRYDYGSDSDEDNEDHLKQRGAPSKRYDDRSDSEHTRKRLADSRLVARRKYDERRQCEQATREEYQRHVAMYNRLDEENDKLVDSPDKTQSKIGKKKKKKKERKQSRRDFRSPSDRFQQPDGNDAAKSRSSSKSSRVSNTDKNHRRYVRRVDEDLPLTERQPPPYLFDEDSQQELPPLPKLSGKNREKDETKLYQDTNTSSVPKVVQERHEERRKLNLSSLKNLQSIRDVPKKVATSPRTRKVFDYDSDSSEKATFLNKKHIIEMSGDHPITLNLEPSTKSGANDYLKKSGKSPKSKESKSPRKAGKEVSSKSAGFKEKSSDRKESKSPTAGSQKNQRDWSYDDRSRFSKKSDDNKERKKRHRSRDSSDESTKRQKTSRSRSWSYSSRDRGRRNTPPARLLARWQSRRQEAMRRIPWRHRRYESSRGRKAGYSRSPSSRSNSSTAAHSPRRRRHSKSSRSQSVDRRYRNRSNVSPSPEKHRRRRYTSLSDASHSGSPSSYKKSTRNKRKSRSHSNSSDDTASRKHKSTGHKRRDKRDHSSSSSSSSSSDDDTNLKHTKSDVKHSLISIEKEKKKIDEWAKQLKRGRILLPDSKFTAAIAQISANKSSVTAKSNEPTEKSIKQGPSPKSDDMNIGERQATPHLVIKSQLTDGLLASLDAEISSIKESHKTSTATIVDSAKNDAADPSVTEQKPIWQEEVVSSGPSILAALSSNSVIDSQATEQKTETSDAVVASVSVSSSGGPASALPSTMSTGQFATTNPELIAKRGWSFQKKSPIRLVPRTPPKSKASESRSRKRSRSYSRSRSSSYSSRSRSSSYSRRYHRRGKKSKKRHSPTYSSSYSSRSDSYRRSRSRYKRSRRSPSYSSRSSSSSRS